MIRYVLKRVVLMPFLLLASTFVIFALVNFSPTDPAIIMLGSEATPEAVAELRDELGLDDPFLVQYINYVGNALKGDMGSSYYTRTPVFQEVVSRIPTTLKLTFGGIIFAMLVGIPLGVICGVKQYGWADNLFTTLAMFIAAMPAFWLALLLMLLFCMKLKWFPTMGIENGFMSFVLPIITVSLPYIGTYLRYTRSSMLDTIRQDYVTTARSKGNKELVVIMKHAFRNALMPLVTITGLYVAGLMSSAVVVESVFALPGVGLLVLDAIKKKDTPVVMGCIVFLSMVFLVVTLLMDVVYAFLDPRIKASYIKKQKKASVKHENKEALQEGR